MIDIDIITHSFKKRNANFTTAVHLINTQITINQNITFVNGIT